MLNVVFVAPFFLETTLRFVNAVADLPGVRLGLVSQDPPEKLPGPLASKLAAHVRVESGLDPRQITEAVGVVSERLGPIHRLIATLEELQVPIAQVRAALGIEGMDVETARNFRDKARMKTVLRQANVPCARHRLATSSADAHAFVQEVGFPVVVKPPEGAGARQTFRIDQTADLDRFLDTLPPTGEDPVLMEEFITGEEYSFDCVFLKGKPVWHSFTHYLPTPLEVLNTPWIQWAVLLPREIDGPDFDEIRSVAFRAIDVLGMQTGLSHMEWFRRPDGSVAISEVAARPPGSQFTTLLSLAHEFDLYGAWAHLMVFEEFEAPTRRHAVGAAYLRGQGHGRVQAIHGLDVAQRELGDLVVEAKLPRAGQAPSGTYEGEGYVVLRHEETSVVEKALSRLVQVVRVELG